MHFHSLVIELVPTIKVTTHPLTMDLQNIAERFHRDGYAIVRQVLSGQEIEEVERTR